MPPTNRAVILLLLIASVTSVFAYVPAQPTNSSQAAAAGGLNITDISKLYLGWYPNGFVCLPSQSFSVMQMPNLLLVRIRKTYHTSWQEMLVMGSVKYVYITLDLTKCL